MMGKKESDQLARAIPKTDAFDRDLAFELAKLLDAALPLLREAADREAIAEAGKPMRQITHQSRYDAARRAVAASADAFGYHQ